ncbi:MAG: hypothetical protein ACOCW3_03945 [Spirochaetota bacterium]
MQMRRMWILAWDSNVRQPYRVNDVACRRHVPESMHAVWLSRLDTPPVRWRKGQRGSEPVATKYARVDSAFADLQGR